jgi:hypothetical protein
MLLLPYHEGKSIFFPTKKPVSHELFCRLRVQPTLTQDFKFPKCHLPCTPNPYWAWKPRSIYLHSLLHIIQATTSNKAQKTIATLYMLGWTIGSNKTGGIRFKNQKTWPRTNPWLIVYPYLAIRAPAALKEENKLFYRYSHFCCVRKSCFMAVLNSSTESPCLTQMRGDEKMKRMIFTFYGTFTCKTPSLWCDSTMERSLL